MLIAHEAPIEILEDIINITDYQYALVHLFDKNPEYYNFFKRCIIRGEEVLLDNSIFELKTAFDAAKYAQYIRELKPTYFIVPDVLEDSEATIESYKKFKESYSYLPGLWIGAVQGKTYQDIVECYKFMSENADYIAISFDFSWYQTIVHTNITDPHRAMLTRMAYGRTKLINMLKCDGYWSYNKPHHLLGCSLPIEMRAYRHDHSIRSVDTSNPVVAGLKGVRYMKDIGMTFKPKELLADLINSEVDTDQFENIIFNISQFKSLCNN
jgi:hypothetical protein